jgi:hypothetical protein
MVHREILRESKGVVVEGERGLEPTKTKAKKNSFCEGNSFVGRGRGVGEKGVVIIFCHPNPSFKMFLPFKI